MSVTTCLRLLHRAQQRLAAMRPQRRKHASGCCSSGRACAQPRQQVASPACCALPKPAAPPVTKLPVGKGRKARRPKGRAVRLAAFA